MLITSNEQVCSSCDQPFPSDSRPGLISGIFEGGICTVRIVIRISEEISVSTPIIRLESQEHERRPNSRLGNLVIADTRSNKASS